MATEYPRHNNVPDPTASIRRIYIADDCLDLSYTQEILDRVDTTKVEVLPAGRLTGASAIHDPKAFSEGKRDETIEIYKTREDAGLNYTIYETLQKLMKILFPNKANIFDIFMVGQRISFDTTSTIIAQIAEFLEKNSFYQDLCINQSSLLKQESILWAELSAYFKVFMRKGRLISDARAKSLINKMQEILDEIITIQQHIIDNGQDYF